MEIPQPIQNKISIVSLLEANPNIKAESSANMQDLRRLILGLEIDELNTLKNRLDDSENFSREVGLIIAEALKKKSQDSSGELSDVLFPLVEESILKSVSKDPKPLADAMFPIMGPAIRRAISETFRKMIQSLNENIENRFSMKGIKWRFEALTTGKSYAEIVLLNSLEYHVSEVFLIHKETGLLLHHVVADNSDNMEADMVSGMLKAIQDFILDSFHLDKTDELGSIQVGELTVWIEQGPKVILAAIVEGNIPGSYRDILKSTTELISQKYSKELKTFDGDTSFFESTKELLLHCFVKNQTVKKKKSIAGWILLSLLIVFIGYWIFNSVQHKHRWTNAIKQIQTIDGIVLTNYEKHHSNYFISGLKDLSVPDPYYVFVNNKIDTSRVEFNWEYFVSLNENLIFQKLKSQISIPNTIQLEIRNGDLKVTGEGSIGLRDSLLEFSSRIDGIKTVNISNLKIGEELIIQKYKEELQNSIILFGRGLYVLNSDHLPILNNIGKILSEVILLQNEFNRSIKFNIIGFSDPYGPASANKYISYARAQAVANYLTNNGIDKKYFVVESNTSDMDEVDSTSRKVIIRLLEIEE